MDNSPEHGINYHEKMNSNSKIINIKMELTPKLSRQKGAFHDRATGRFAQRYSDPADRGDAYGEDPTVNRLEEMAAAKVGMEAGLYVPSGSMGNRCALVAHTRPGDEVIYGAGAHVFGGYRAQSAAEACLAARSVPLEFGVMQPEQVDEIADQANPNRARPSLVWIEIWAGAARNWSTAGRLAAS